jgi:hypothetical protein
MLLAPERQPEILEAEVTCGCFWLGKWRCFDGELKHNGLEQLSCRAAYRSSLPELSDPARWGKDSGRPPSPVQNPYLVAKPTLILILAQLTAHLVIWGDRALNQAAPSTPSGSRCASCGGSVAGRTVPTAAKSGKEQCQ